jgi:hypothetical protein
MSPPDRPGTPILVWFLPEALHRGDGGGWEVFSHFGGLTLARLLEIITATFQDPCVARVVLRYNSRPLCSYSPTRVGKSWWVLGQKVPARDPHALQPKS